MGTDILDEDFIGDLDEELADVDEFLGQQTPAVYLGELVDEDLKNKYDIYACTRITLILEPNKYILVGDLLDVVGDVMYAMDPVEFNSLDEAVAFLRTKKLHDCPIDLDSLLVI